MKHRQNGQTLIEALVSLSIAVTIIAAITVVVISSLNNANFTRNQNQATLYAQEGLEVVKRMAASQTTSFFDSQLEGDYCLAKDKKYVEELLVSAAPARCGTNVGNFSREIGIDHQNAVSCDNNTKVTVKVMWRDNKCPGTQTGSGQVFCHEVVLTSCVSDYNPSKPSGNLL